MTPTLPEWKFQRIGIYGFRSASSELPTKNDCVCAIAKNLTESSGPTYVVGSHDGVKMRGATLKEFGSNEALAKSRAITVFNALKACNADIAKHIYAAASLPAELGPAHGAERLARGRRVDIYAGLKEVPPQCNVTASTR